MALRIKPGARIALIGIAATGVVLGMKFGIIPMPAKMKSIVASRVALPSQADAQVANVTAIPYPSKKIANIDAVRFPIDEWEWNAQSAVHGANGGAETTKGSLMEKHGVNLSIHRQDSNSQMKIDLADCAKQLHDGEKTCIPTTTAVAAILVMGDSAGQWMADLNPQLKKLGPEYQVEIIGAVGRSDGEDGLLGPSEWKSNPKSMLGKTIVGVIRDGDWNIALNYMGANGLRNNPDLHTYDPDAVNWIAAPDEDYIKAVTDVYIPNRCEKRDVVKDGHLTGKQADVCPDGVVTWLPGDEQAVHGRPGTTKIISSHQYAAQMPDIVLGIKKFFNDNRDEINGFFAATFQEADQIKAFQDARKKAGEISAEIYKDQTGSYWYGYYNGIKDPATGQPLGGSQVFNLEDNVNYFGLDGRHNNNMRATYETFARIDVENYPDLFKGEHAIPPYKDVVDTSFILGAQAKLNTEGVQSAEAESTDYSKAQNGEVLGHEAVYISFNTGSDTPTPEGMEQLHKLRDSLAVNSALALQIDGYTDNTGSDTVNIPLSHRRAQAVKQYFQKTAPASFPEARFKSIEGHGSQDPIAPNTTTQNKAKNRRVEIVQIGG
jgi:OOP family OmpA-OmpF porin